MMLLHSNCVVNNESLPSYHSCELGFPSSFSPRPITYTRTPQNTIVLSALQREVPQRSRSGAVLPLLYQRQRVYQKQKVLPCGPEGHDKS